MCCSMRNADELSTTTAPFDTAIGPNFFEVEPPAENNARCTPSNELSVSSVTVTDLPANGSCLPAERADASARTSVYGNFRFSRQLRISTPTAPVAPTTAMTGLAGRRPAGPAAEGDDIGSLLIEQLGAWGAGRLRIPLETGATNEEAPSVSRRGL